MYVGTLVSSLGFRAQHASALLCPEEEPMSGEDIATLRAAQYEEAFSDPAEGTGGAEASLGLLD
jgi:hypothetical protein